ncbi:MAG: RdgB/HAM1 family non-canonical purine NTP pyrophosphatase, partial [Bacteroidota bacterium]
RSLTDIGCTEDIPETGDTLAENAAIKANHVTQTYGLNCFSDDTGLLITALNGAPGVYSARYAGPQKNAEENMDKVLMELKETSDRSAYFQTVIHLNWKGQAHSFVGEVHGKIIREKRGDGGFGYDPIFVPEGYEQTFAELPLSIKNQISHRGKAFQKLMAFLKSS